jgi:hypothetical protein
MLVQTKLPKYIYDPINQASPSIRLLTLLPSTEKYARLSGQLHTASLEPYPPTYEALSYVWDDYRWAFPRSPDTFPLQIDGRDLSITRSLALALFQVRHRRQPRLLCVSIKKTWTRRVIRSNRCTLSTPSRTERSYGLVMMD